MSAAPVPVLVVHARQRRQIVREVVVDEGASVRDAILASGILDEVPDARDADVGIWGRRVTPDHPVRSGDRIEIYRPLAADPKETRRRRACRRAGAPG